MKVEAEVRDIKNETHDVKTFRLDPEQRVNFTPGQYCLVSIIGSEEHKGTKKPFTYANSPTKNYVELTIKRIGEFTSTMHNLGVGDRLLLDGPRGELLNFDETVEEDVVFLAGGSGITPFISAIRYAVDLDLENHMTLIFSNRTKEDIIFEDELKEINQMEKFNIVSTLSDDWPEDWDGETGIIDREMVTKYVDKPGEKIWYICGPPPMIDAMNELLQNLDVPETNVRYENWMIPGKGDN